LSNGTTIDATNYPSFVLSSWPPVNQNEYENGVDTLGNQQLVANYGAVYTITITNPAGKRIKITPNWTTGNGNNYARIVLWTSTNGWYTTTTIGIGGYWIMGTSTSSTFTFKFVLPGGNYGNVKFEIIN
jgi:hypothetical protein